MPVRSRAARFLAVIALLAVSVSVAGTVVAAPDADAAGAGEGPLDSGRTVAGNATGASATVPSVAQDPVESINQTIRIDVRADGNARWTVTMRATVANGSDVRLSDLEDAYENGETEYLSVDPYRAASEQVSAATGRSMDIRNVSRRASVTNRTLSMELSFTWTNFGSLEGDQLAVRDVFNGPAGEWFPSLEGFQTLVVTPPDGYAISSVDDEATLRNRTLRWFGPVRFDDRTPYVVYVESSAGAATTTTALSPTTTGPGPGQSTDGGLLVPAVVVLLVGLLAVLAVVASRSDRPLIPPASEAETEASDGGTEAAPAPADGGTDAEPADGESTAEPSDGEPTGGAGTAAAAGDDVDEELLSDEERVERLLERNGGRMKQANIVSETDWSNAKVSQLLSSMAEDGRIEKLRIGRENLISFPDEDDERP